MSGMKRREFITLLGGAAAWPLAARAQQAGKIHKVGYLSPSLPSVYSPLLFDNLRELGWIEGKNVTFEYRFAENRLERLPELASELVRLNVDVIVGVGTLGPLAAKQATSTIERARCRQPADRRLAYAVGAREIGLHSAVSEALDHFLALMGGETATFATNTRAREKSRLISWRRKFWSCRTKSRTTIRLRCSVPGCRWIVASGWRPDWRRRNTATT